jgi:hypothetical protein
MTFLSETIRRISPDLSNDAGFLAAVAAYRRNPTDAAFDAVVEWVAKAVTPSDDDKEVSGRFSGCLSPAVASAFFYAAATEVLLGVDGHLAGLIEIFGASYWLDAKPVLMVAGVQVSGRYHAI